MKIIAHRGSSLIWPENTMLAFNKAHEAGATGFETDLRLSKDQEIILSHDDNLQRFGHGDKTISRLNVGEIQDIVIKSPTGAYRDNIITLRELIETYPDKDYIFDCKISEPLLFERLKRLLLEHQFRRQLWFLTWSQKADDLVRAHFPNAELFPRESRTRQWGWASIAGLGHFLEPENRILSLPMYHFNLPVVSKRQIRSIRGRGKTFVGYLVNTQKDVRRANVLGVQIVLTDRPDLISELSKPASPISSQKTTP